jgi:DNA-binding HxlR family transcriptional regulator
VIVLHALRDGTKRYGELNAMVGAVSPKMLTQTPRRLERYGFVGRKVYPAVPPRSEYTLTSLGETLSEPLAALCRCAESHLDAARRSVRAASGERRAAIAPADYDAQARCPAFAAVTRRRASVASAVKAPRSGRHTNHTDRSRLCFGPRAVRRLAVREHATEREDRLVEHLRLPPDFPTCDVQEANLPPPLGEPDLERFTAKEPG